MSWNSSQTETFSWGNSSSNETSGGSQVTGPDMLMRFVCDTGIALPVSVLGTIGNILALVVLQKHRHRLSTTVLLQALAIADTSVLLSTVLLRSLRYMHYFAKAPFLGPYMAVYHYIFRVLFPLVYFIRLTGTWITVLLTIDRYIAVRFPLHAHRLCTVSRALRNVAILAILSLLFTTPRFFEYAIDSSNKSFGFRVTSLLKNRTYTIVYRIVLFFTFMYLVPMILLVVLNAHLLITLRVAESYRAGVTDNKNINKTSRSITATVVTVVLVTIVCNVSAMLSHLLWSLAQCFAHLSYLDHHRRYMALISNIFVTLNSAINFVIYCFCSRNFRMVLLQMCSCRRKSSERTPLGRSETVSLTVQTGTSTNYIPLTATISKKGRAANGLQGSPNNRVDV